MILNGPTMLDTVSNPLSPDEAFKHLQIGFFSVSNSDFISKTDKRLLANVLERFENRLIKAQRKSERSVLVS